MKLYSENDSYKIYNDDMLDMLQVIEPESIDAIVCDPPYELGFMNKSWDSTGIAFKKETWQNCFEVLKPGGYLLAFGGSRTYHRIACAIEDAGFEIRDCVMYLYGCGFSKSYNIGLAIDKKNGVDNRTGNIRTDGVNNQNICYDFKTMKPKFEERIAQNEWQGWGTCLKPAYEPIIVARKPFKGSVVDNIIKYRVGGINIDGCKIGNEKRTQFSGKSNGRIYSECSQKNAHFETVEGRFPANVITDGSEEVAKGMPNTTSTPIAEESAMRLDNIIRLFFEENSIEDMPQINFERMKKYLNNKKGDSWYIDNLEIFKNKLELNDFWVKCDSETGKDCKHCSFLVCENNESVGHEEWCNSEHDHMRRLKRAPLNYQYVWVEENANRKD
jgi:hypothetical protein